MKTTILYLAVAVIVISLSQGALAANNGNGSGSGRESGGAGASGNGREGGGAGASGGGVGADGGVNSGGNAVGLDNQGGYGRANAEFAQNNQYGYKIGGGPASNPNKWNGLAHRDSPWHRSDRVRFNLTYFGGINTFRR